MTTAMSNTVCFCNNGTLDKRAFTMLGLSAKTTEQAIGFFGTGFKYAIAALLREQHSIEIIARVANGYTKYTFEVINGTFRGKKIDCIVCSDNNGNSFELPFTTHLGANWKIWQAYRELYTNAKDEGGGVHLVENSDCKYDHSSADGVQVIVSGPAIAQVYDLHEKYFLEAADIARGSRMRAVAKQPMSDNVVYYKTMYTGTKLDKESYFTYDYVRTVELTEDRTLADTWYLRQHIAEVWLRSMSYEQLIEHLPKVANPDYYENTLDVSYHDGSDDFNKACAYLLKMHKPMPMWARDVYIKTMPFDEQVETYKPTRYQKVQLANAITILAHHKCVIDVEKLFLCVSLPNDVLGYYRDGNIYIAKETFDRGFEKLVGTLYEEWLHMTAQCDDMSRNMQNLLIDRIAALMEQVYEMEQV